MKVAQVLPIELPPGFRHRVVMMRRDPEEVVESQRKMLARAGRTGGAIAADALKRAFAARLEGVLRWAAEQPNFQVLDDGENRFGVRGHKFG